MSTFKNIEEAREFFKHDKFALNSGIYIEQLDGNHCVCSMEITENHINGFGQVMGGAIFTLADLAFTAAMNNAYLPTVSLQTSIHFLSEVKGKKLFAETSCVKDGRTTVVYNVNITDDTGRHIAQFVGTGHKFEDRNRFNLEDFLSNGKED